MKKYNQTLFLIGGAVLAYYLYSKSQTAAAPASNTGNYGQYLNNAYQGASQIYSSATSLWNKLGL